MLTQLAGVALRSSAHLRVLPRVSDYAVYHRIVGALSLVDKGALDLLCYLQTPRSADQLLHDHPSVSAEKLAAFLQFFRERRFLIDAEGGEDAVLDARKRQREEDLGIGRQIRVIQLVLSNRCNFKCKYCYEGLGSTPLSETIYARSSPERLLAQTAPTNAAMSMAAAEAYLEGAIRLARKAGTPALMVQFFGGEPLVNWRTIQHVFERFGNGQNHGIALSYSIITNGSLITDEIARAFRRFDVPVVVSYDSPASDARPMAGGANSHEVVRRGLRLLRRHGTRVALNCVLGETTFGDFDRSLIEFAEEHDVAEIGVVLDLDPAFYARRPAKEIVDRLWDVCVYGRLRGVLVTGYWHQIFQGLAVADRYGQIGFKNCSAMGVQFSIEPSGDVFSCKASGGHFGNILAPEALLASDTYRRYALRGCTSPEPCKTCLLEHFCGGMCLGPVENDHRGNIYAVEESACDVYREITRRFILSTDRTEVPVFHIAADGDAGRALESRNTRSVLRGEEGDIMGQHLGRSDESGVTDTARDVTSRTRSAHEAVAALGQPLTSATARLASPSDDDAVARLLASAGTFDKHVWPHITTRFTVLEHDFAVRVGNPAIARYIEQVFEPFAATGVPTHLYSLADLGPQFRLRHALFYDGEKIDACSSAVCPFLLSTLFWHANRVAVDSCSQDLLLHAAAAEHNGRALLLAAPAGSGKSTLVAALVRAGLRYLTDDVTVIDVATGQVKPFPKSITLKNGSRDVLPDLRPMVDPELQPYLDGQWHVTPRSFGPDAIAPCAPPRFVIFPRYERGADCELSPIRPAQALVALTQLSFNLSRHGSSAVAALAAIVRQSSCYRLSVGNLSRARDLVLDLLSERTTEVSSDRGEQPTAYFACRPDASISGHDRGLVSAGARSVG